MFEQPGLAACWLASSVGQRNAPVLQRSGLFRILAGITFFSLSFCVFISCVFYCSKYYSKMETTPYFYYRVCWFKGLILHIGEHGPQSSLSEVITALQNDHQQRYKIIHEKQRQKCFHTPSKGLFTWREEDASTRMILEDGKTLRWVYMHKFRSVRCLSRQVSRRK